MESARPRHSTASRAWPWSACRRATCPALLALLAARGCRAVILVGGGSGACRLEAEQARAVREAARRRRLRLVGPDRVGVIVPGRRLEHRARRPHAAAGRSRLRHPVRFDRHGDAGVGDGRAASASRASSPWARAPRSRSATSWTTWRSDLVDPGRSWSTCEGIADARRFMSAARAAARVKPVLVLKAGRQIGPPAGAPAARMRLHRDRVYDAAFARAGLVRVDIDRGAVRRRRQPRRRGRAPRPRPAQRPAGAADQRPCARRARGRRAARRRRHAWSRPTPPIYGRDRAERSARWPRWRARSTSVLSRAPMPTPRPSRCCWRPRRSTASW